MAKIEDPKPVLTDSEKVAARVEAAQDQWMIKKIRTQELEAQREEINEELVSLALELAALEAIEVGHADAEAVLAGTAKDISKPLEIKLKQLPPIEIDPEIKPKEKE